MKLDKVVEALKPPTYEKINELRIAAEKENATLKAELIKAKNEQSLFNERVKEEVRVQSNKIHSQYERDKAISENVQDALQLVESQLRCMNCLDVVSDSRSEMEFERLKIKRNLLIELLTVDEDDE